MKPIPCLVLLSFILVSSFRTSHASQVTDDFNASFVNTNKWQVSLTSASASATEGNGFLTLRNGAELISWESFTAPFEIAGRIRFAGNRQDTFTIVIRTTGVPSGSSLALSNGIAFRIQPLDDSGTVSNVFLIERQADSFVYAKTNRSLVMSQFYDFKIIDTGTNFSFYFGDLTTPLLTGSDSFIAGEKVGFFSRSNATNGALANGSEVDLDFVTITSPPPPTLGIFPAVEIQFETKAGKQYEIQFSGDSENWTNLAPQILGDGTPYHRFYRIRGNPKLFYRAQELPTNDDRLIEMAEAAPGMPECIAKAQASGLRVRASVNTVGVCPDGSDQKEVLIIGGPNCPPGQPCPFFARIVARVTFDCSGQIASTECI